jgi:arabinogalactan endo-1,4-beta-galactosidase
MKTIKNKFILIMFLATLPMGCSKSNKDDDTDNKEKPVVYTPDQFVTGADLSYVNQVEDHGGVYLDSGEVRDPYLIFKNHGANTVRIRLWHNPLWTKEVYGASGTQLYSDIKDAEKSMKRAKDLGMTVCLDIHYSDTWADPGNQEPPAAWQYITDINVLKDSVYRYTLKTLNHLNSQGLMPEMVQIGNEINCGMLITGTLQGFPDLNACDGKWKNLGDIINEGIRAVREVSAWSDINTQVVLHVADPKNVKWWFDNITSTGGVTDFDIIGFSYYPLWHTTISYYNITTTVADLKARFQKKVMILETAYPWTKENADSYANLFYNQAPVSGFPYTVDGQKNFLVDLTQQLISVGLDGIIYWEPAWISSQMKDPWGTGSSWENCAFFDFDGNTLPSIDYMTYPYLFPE